MLTSPHVTILPAYERMTRLLEAEATEARQSVIRGRQTIELWRQRHCARLGAGHSPATTGRGQRHGQS